MSSAQEKPGSVHLFGGASIPVGEFGSTTDDLAGYAATGFHIGADGNIKLAPSLTSTTSLILTSNPFDVSTIVRGSSITGEAGSWRNVWALTGLRVSAAVGEHAELFAIVQVGLVFSHMPSIKFTSGAMNATQTEGSSTIFGGGGGLGAQIAFVTITLRYLRCEPEYGISATGNTTWLGGLYEQPTSVVLVSAGVRL